MNSLVYLSNRPRLLFFRSFPVSSVKAYFIRMSSSSTTNVNANGSSRHAPNSSRGMAPSPAIFPNVITGPGSPPGNQPPVTNTIEQAFNQQRVAKDKTKSKKDAHVDIRQRLVQFLAAPASHNDPLRTLSAGQLAALPDDKLLH